MAKVKPIKPVDCVAYESVMLELGKARAMAWVLDQLAPDRGTNLSHALDDAPEDTSGWLHWVVSDALRSALDEIEVEYRKLGTNLMQKEFAELSKNLREKEAAELATPKDGA